jgi:preprotein translocase subunit SecA
LEDELMRLFGGDTISSMMDRIGFSEDEPIEHSIVTKSVETAQKRVEAHNFSIRKNVVEYDNVLNKQRETIYKDRTKVLFEGDLETVFLEMVAHVTEGKLDLYWPVNIKKEEAELEGLLLWVKDLLPAVDAAGFIGSARTREDVGSFIRESVEAVFREKKEIAGPEMQNILRVIIILSTDREWVNQLHEMEGLREGVGLQAYGQKDPLVEYTRIGYEMFVGHMQAIEENVVQHLCRLDLKPQGTSAAPKREAGRPTPSRALRASGGSMEPPVSLDGSAAAAPKGAPRPSAPPKTAPVRVGKKVGRNDPCPCGSGKKYKDCCGKLA